MLFLVGGDCVVSDVGVGACVAAVFTVLPSLAVVITITVAVAIAIAVAFVSLIPYSVASL